MEQRHEMKWAIEEGDSGKDEGLNVFYLDGNDVSYFGCELVGENGNTLTWYFHLTGEKEAHIFIYIHDNCFDSLVDNLDESNRKAVFDAWPLLMNALVRGADDNYSEPALIKLASTEIANAYFWCLAMKIENIDFSDLENWVSDYVSEKLKRLINYLGAMNEQLEKNDISTLSLLAGGIKKGFGSYRTLKLIGGIAGSVLGLPLFCGGDE